MKRLLLTLTLLSTSISFSQTKVIAHKSHSGSMMNFYELVENRDVDMNCHNLGAAPQKIIRNAQLDSVIYVDDTTTIMVTSEVCTDQWDPGYSWIWKAGHDTIYNDEVWNQDDPEEIKLDLKIRRFNFQNSPDSVVFVDFPTDQPQQELDQDSIKTSREAGVDVKQNAVLPVGGDSKPGMGLPLAIVSIVFLSIIVYLRNWRKQLFASEQE